MEGLILLTFFASLTPMGYFAAYRQRMLVFVLFCAIHFGLLLLWITPGFIPHREFQDYDVVAINVSSDYFPNARVIQGDYWTVLTNSKSSKSWTVFVEPGAYVVYGNAQSWVEHTLHDHEDANLINFDTTGMFRKGHSVFAVNNHHPPVLDLSKLDKSLHTECRKGKLACYFFPLFRRSIQGLRHNV